MHINVMKGPDWSEELPHNNKMAQKLYYRSTGNVGRPCAVSLATDVDLRYLQTTRKQQFARAISEVRSVNTSLLVSGKVYY